MAEIRIRDVDPQLKAYYEEKAASNNVKLSPYMKSILEKNLFTREIEKRESKFYGVISDLEIILSRQAEVMENFMKDIELLITMNIENGGESSHERKN